MVKKKTNFIAQAVEGYFHLLKIIMVICMAAMLVLVFGNVFLRYAFNTGITVSEEVSRWFFVWMVFLGALVCMREHGHLGVDTVVKRLPVPAQKVCFFLVQCIMLYASYLILTGGWEQTILNIGTHAAASGLPKTIFYGVGIVFGATAIPIILYDIVMLLSGRLADEKLIGVVESDEALEQEELEKELAHFKS